MANSNRADQIKPEPRLRDLGVGTLCLFGSGFCALIYQTTWMREFCLIFGASTAASAAVAAIFMGGLGLGSALLGPRADRQKSPFGFYGKLELGIALTAMITPLLLLLARNIYWGLGGTMACGEFLGTLLRLLLASLVLILPTFLMGGTLPAAVAAFESEHDKSRLRLAWLYGVNAFGAVTGAMLSTFFFFEHLGNRNTLWLACVINIAVATLALLWSKKAPAPAAEPLVLEQVEPPSPNHNTTTPHFIYAAAMMTGLIFFLLELLWYRMLAPLLGGSTFTYGLILAIALAGIAGGSFLYSLFWAGRKVTPRALSFVWALQAIGVALPYALGDRIAMWAMLSNPVAAAGFPDRVGLWAAIASIVVFPPALVAGFGFPMLVSMLGSGSKHVGRQTGIAYAWNTVGAIAGSLAGGFGLLPLLGALGVWKAATIVLVALGLGAVGISAKANPRKLPIAASLALLLIPLLLLFSTGPTAMWRQNPIGAGRAAAGTISPNGLKEYAHALRRSLVWEADGKESNIGLIYGNGYAFVVNGKSDGAAVGDGHTQVMAGLLAALVHPAPQKTCVVGLGTGSSAGWLADVQSMVSVDVMELEPAIARVARDCAPVNRNVLNNPKAHVLYGDARELLMSRREKYDLIVSEPSNPYRAGVCSLFTREFYQAAQQRLNTNGIFLQWVQGYEVDGATVSTICATLAQTFRSVEIWKAEETDLLFLCSDTPFVYDLAAIKERIAQPPYREALSKIWFVNDVEGVFAHYVANTNMASAALTGGSEINTDNRNLLEFGFARSVGLTSKRCNAEDLRLIAFKYGWHRPQCINGTIDKMKSSDRQASIAAAAGMNINIGSSPDPALTARCEAKQAMAQGNPTVAARAWFSQQLPPSDPYELSMLASALSISGDERTLGYIEQLRPLRPEDADALLWIYWYHRKDLNKAVGYLEKALDTWRESPWVSPQVVLGTFNIVRAASFENENRPLGIRVYQTLSRPFAVKAYEDERLVAWMNVARKLDDKGFTELTRKVFESYEPHIPWSKSFLEARSACYNKVNYRLATRAEVELEEFTRQETKDFIYAKPPQPDRPKPPAMVDQTSIPTP